MVHDIAPPISSASRVSGPMETMSRRRPSGGYVIHGRSDATLNPGGIRIGTAEIYRQVEPIPQILEAIAVGQDWQGDQRIILFVRLAEGVVLTMRS